MSDRDEAARDRLPTVRVHTGERHNPRAKNQEIVTVTKPEHGPDPAAITARAGQTAAFLVTAYRGRPRHDQALTRIKAHLAEHGPDDLPAIWHPLAQEIADLYTANQLHVEPPGEDAPETDFYTRVDNHARRLVVACQSAVDGRAECGAYYDRHLGDDVSGAEVADDPVTVELDGRAAVGMWVALALANKVAESYSEEDRSGPEAP